MGEAVPLAAMWLLSQRWYGDRLDPEFRPKPREVLQGYLAEAGLTTTFWDLSAP